MSRENIELLRRGYAAWLEGGVEAILPYLDSNIEWAQDPGFPGAKTYFGHDGVRAWDAWLQESFEERRVEIDDMFEAGDQVVVLLDLLVRGRGSGVAVRTRMAHLWTIRDGRGLRVRFYLDAEEALRAVGLRE